MTTVAAVIPTIVGREQLLLRALKSVNGQTRLPDQIIVEPDPDRTGAAATRNRAIGKVTCDWIAFLDDDDTWHPQHLAALLDTAQDTGADLVYPWYDGINSTGILATVKNGRAVDPYRVPFGDEQRQHLLTTANFIPVTVLVRTALIRQVGGFSPPPWASPDNPCEDWGCWIKLLEAGATFAHCPQVTWTWKGHAGHTSGRGLVTAAAD